MTTRPIVMVRLLWAALALAGCAIILSSIALGLRGDWLKEQRFVHTAARLGAELEFTEEDSLIRLIFPDRCTFLFERVSLADFSEPQGPMLLDSKVDRLRSLRRLLNDLGHMGHLKSLDLRGTDINDTDLDALVHAPRLRIVYLYGTCVTESGITKLKQMRPSLDVVMDRNTVIIVTDPIL